MVFDEIILFEMFRFFAVIDGKWVQAFEFSLKQVQIPFISNLKLTNLSRNSKFYRNSFFLQQPHCKNFQFPLRLLSVLNQIGNSLLLYFHHNYFHQTIYRSMLYIFHIHVQSRHYITFNTTAVSILNIHIGACSFGGEMSPNTAARLKEVSVCFSKLKTVHNKSDFFSYHREASCIYFCNERIYLLPVIYLFPVYIYFESFVKAKF